jgi:predicted ABC-class ATPase
LKRLKSIMASMDYNTSSYTEMYNGRILIYDPRCPGAPPFMDENPTYYSENIGFEIRVSRRLALDKPTVTVIIPGEMLVGKARGDMPLKRLKYYMQHMENDTTAYKEMYEGEMVMNFPASPTGHVMEPEIQHDPSYWYQDMAMEVEENHKLAKDKPSLTWYVPAERLGVPGTSAGESPAYAEAAADFCLREFGRYIDELNEELYNRSRPDYENGKYDLCSCGGEVLARNGAYFALHAQKDYVNGSGIKVHLLDDGLSRPPRMCLCLKLQVQLPRKKLKKAMRMLCRDLPETVERFVGEFDQEGLNQALELAEKQACIRSWLAENGFCAFVANGSILPREKGTDLPMKGAVPFQSPLEDEVEICGIRGMGIRKGVTVITGGGYSGKSTLLDAVSAGIYNHVQGDGRELCITDDTAVTISAEDGRSVKCVNISPFIKWLPQGNAGNFSTEHASGSTSQAANIAEAVDGGAGLLVIDEDRSATNFMIRDGKMKELIAKEPITPFTDRVRELSRNLGVSTILVIGGSGEYLSVADRVYLMEDFCISDVTQRARDICRRHGGACCGFEEKTENLPAADWAQRRKLYAEGFTSYPQGCGSERLQVLDMGFIVIGDERIDIRGLTDIASPCQLEALAFMLRYLEIRNNEQEISLKKIVDELYDRIQREGLDFLYSSYFTTCGRFLELPRKQELLALINRMRKLRFEGPA